MSVPIDPKQCPYCQASLGSPCAHHRGIEIDGLPMAGFRPHVDDDLTISGLSVDGRRFDGLRCFVTEVSSDSFTVQATTAKLHFQFLINAVTGVIVNRPANELERLRAAVRAHRDERGDDRCWLDDERLYAALPEGYTPPARNSAVEIENCKRFIACRHNPATEYVSPQREIERLRKSIKRLVWRRLDPRHGTKGHVPSGSVGMWRRMHDNYVFMGHHDYSNVFPIDNPQKPICLVTEAWWCPIPCEEIPIEP